MTAKPRDLDTRSKIHRRSRNTVATVLTITALVFAAYGAAAMSSFNINSSPVQAAYAQEQGQQQGQQQSAVADRATRMSAAVDAALRYYAKAIGEQYVEADVRPIPGAENINVLEDVTIPSVPVGNNEGNTTGIVSMGDYLIATGLIDKSYEQFLDTARVMYNVTTEDVNELQTTLLQFHTLIDQRAPYTLAEDVVQNLQGHLQRAVASTEQFTASGATAGMTTGTTDGGGATTTPSETLGNATTSTTTPPSDTGTADTGTTSDTTTLPSPSPLMQ